MLLILSLTSKYHLKCLCGSHFPKHSPGYARLPFTTAGLYQLGCFHLLVPGTQLIDGSCFSHLTRHVEVAFWKCCGGPTGSPTIQAPLTFPFTISTILTSRKLTHGCKAAALVITSAFEAGVRSNEGSKHQGRLCFMRKVKAFPTDLSWDRTLSPGHPNFRKSGKAIL